MNKEYLERLFTPEQWKKVKHKPPYKYYWEPHTIKTPKPLKFWIDNMDICEHNAKNGFGKDKVDAECLLHYYKWWGSYQYYNKKLAK